MGVVEGSAGAEEAAEVAEIETQWMESVYML